MCQQQIIVDAELGIESPPRSPSPLANMPRSNDFSLDRYMTQTTSNGSEIIPSSHEDPAHYERPPGKPTEMAVLTSFSVIEKPPTVPFLYGDISYIMHSPR